MTRHKNNIPPFNVKHDYFKSSFFPSTIIEWNKLDPNKRNPQRLSLFKKHISGFIRPFANSTFHCHNPKGLKLIKRPSLRLSHLQFHKFKHSFQNILNRNCNCVNVEKTMRYLINYPNVSNERLTLFKKLQSVV